MTVFFGLKDVKVASWTNANAWGTNRDLLGVKVYNITEETVSGTHEGDDRRIAVHAQVIGAKAEVEFIYSSGLAETVMTGRTTVTSGADEYQLVGADNMPYFGINGVVSGAEGATSAVELFIPKCKLMEGWSHGANYGQFMTIRATLLCVWNDDTNYKFMKRIIRGTATTTVAIPPTYNA